MCDYLITVWIGGVVYFSSSLFHILLHFLLRFMSSLLASLMMRYSRSVSSSPSSSLSYSSCLYPRFLRMCLATSPSSSLMCMTMSAVSSTQPFWRSHSCTCFWSLLKSMSSGRYMWGFYLFTLWIRQSLSS